MGWLAPNMFQMGWNWDRHLRLVLVLDLTQISAYVSKVRQSLRYDFVCHDPTMNTYIHSYPNLTHRPNLNFCCNCVCLDPFAFHASLHARLYIYHLSGKWVVWIIAWWLPSQLDLDLGYVLCLLTLPFKLSLVKLCLAKPCLAQLISTFSRSLILCDLFNLSIHLYEFFNLIMGHLLKKFH